MDLEVEEPPAIKVIHGDKEPVSFPVVPKEGVGGVFTLSLEFLSSICTGATGLTTLKNNEKKAMLLRDGKFEIYDTTLEYETAVPESNSQNWKLQLANHAHKDKIMEIRRRIKNTPVLDEKKTSESTKRLKISDIREAKGVTLKAKTKVIKMGIKFKFEKDDETERYTQLKENNGGGMINLTFEVNKLYSVNDVINLGISKFTSAKAQKYIEHSTHRLGVTEDKRDIEIQEFCDKNGTNIGLIEYFQLYDLFRNRKNLYLLCTATEEFWGAAGKITDKKNLSSQSDNESSTDSEQDSNIDDQLPDNNENLPLKKQDDQNFVHPKSATTLLADVTNRLKLRTKKKVSESNLCKEMQIDTQNEFLRKSQPSNTEKPCLLIKNNHGSFSSLNNILRLRYWIYGFSEYGSNQFFCREADRDQVYDEMKRQGSEPHCVLDQFDPYNYGFLISRIEVNDYTLMQTTFAHPLKEQTTSEQLPEYAFTYPNLQERKHATDPHCILYDLDEVVGSYDGKWCLGVVPHCYRTCAPKFFWFKDGKLFAEGENIFTLFDVPFTDSPSSWYCKIQCSNNPSAIVSKTFEFKVAMISANSENPQGATSLEAGYLAGVQLLKKEQFTVDKDRQIGHGQQSVVYLGTFGQHKVAVKTIKIYSHVSKDTQNEIKVLQSINHPNFISLKAVYIEKKQIQLLLEYFYSINLSDLIDDENYHEEYKLRENKFKIVLQLTTAVKFLQDRENPILHRDLKPANILVNKNLEVKICDFGLSKFTMTLTSLRSTVGRPPVGTFVYSAPEILILNEPATVWSDMWSLAIIVVELFKEDSAWDINDIAQLQQLMKEEKIPDTFSINDVQFDKISSIVKGCFRYKKEDRPTSVTFHDAVKNAFKEQL